MWREKSLRGWKPLVYTDVRGTAFAPLYPNELQEFDSIFWIFSDPLDHKWPQMPQAVPRMPTETALLPVAGPHNQRVSGSIFWATSLSKLFFKMGNFVTMGMKERWSSMSCLSGVWLLQGRGDPFVRWLQRTRLLGHWLMLKIIIRTLVPAHFEVLKIKIPMTARPEKSKDLKQSLKTLAKSEKH